MYADNGKISNRQTFRLYVFDLIGISTLLIPPYLAKLSGCDGIFAILIGSFLGYLYLRYLGYVMAKMDTDMGTYLEQSQGKFIRYISYLFVFFHSCVTAGFALYIFCNLMQYSLVKEVGYGLLLFTTVLVAAYSVSGGIESRARVYEVLFWLILVPYVIMMLMSVGNVERVYLNDFATTSAVDMAKSSYLVFLFLMPLFFSLFLLSKKQEKKYGGNMIKTVSKALAVSVVILLGSYVLLLGNFGENSLATMRFPVITLMSTIQLKGNFLKRMDALMLAVWFFTLYALLNLHMHYGTAMLKKLWKKAKNWQVIAVAVIAGVVAWLLKENAWATDLFLDYYSYVAVPVMIAGPGLILLAGKGKKALAATMAVVLSVYLIGCGATELESRCFPMMVAVDYDADKEKVIFYESFPNTQDENKTGLSTNEIQVPIKSGATFLESKESFEKDLNKDTDYNHLKVVIIGEELVEHANAYHDMLKTLAETEEFPRNTYVCVTEDIEDLIKLQDKLPQELGTYLEEYLENHEEKKDRLLSLGNLLDEEENHKMILYAPYLEAKDTYVEWGGYYGIGENAAPIELD